MDPPSRCLPSVRSFGTLDAKELADCVRYLRLIYNPEVRGSRRIEKSSSSLSRSSELPRETCLVSADDANTRRASKATTQDQIQATSQDAHDLQTLRWDTFERSHAINWLTRLISFISSELANDGEDPYFVMLEEILSQASSLLAICSGTAGAGSLTRTYTFYLAENKDHISVNVKDIPLDNADYASLGAQTWGGACVLSEIIAENPGDFGLLENAQSELRVLELGAGTGLVSLTTGKVLQRLGRRAQLLATDFYAPVVSNLQSNIELNFPPSPSQTEQMVSVKSGFLDWEHLSHSDKEIIDMRFDVVFGADIIYEANHAIWIKSCLYRLLRRPEDSGTLPAFHLVIPLRATHNVESATIDEVFGDNPTFDESSERIGIVSSEYITCEAERGATIDYKYYKIGWLNN